TIRCTHLTSRSARSRRLLKPQASRLPISCEAKSARDTRGCAGGRGDFRPGPPHTHDGCARHAMIIDEIAASTRYADRETDRKGDHHAPAPQAPCAVEIIR